MRSGEIRPSEIRWDQGSGEIRWDQGSGGIRDQVGSGGIRDQGSGIRPGEIRPKKEPHVAQMNDVGW